MAGICDGRVVIVTGAGRGVAEPWHAGPEADKHDRWDAAELGKVVPDLLARARPKVGPFGQTQAPPAALTS